MRPLTHKPKMARGRMRSQKSSTNKLWNERFQITESKNNESFHPYFKEYFDKPIKKKPEQISLSVIMKPKNPIIRKIEE
jgi:hypothetical protein